MYLKFIGEDKSMGLRRGHIYNVVLTSYNDYVWVWWGFGKKCPYSSFESLMKNWEQL